jgi:integrase
MTHTVQDVCDAYYMSSDFNGLRDTTKVDYKYFLGILCGEIGTMPHEYVSSELAKALYEAWVLRGISYSNHLCSVASQSFNYGIRTGYTHNNPFAKLKRVTKDRRLVTWTNDDVVLFLNTAYKTFHHRNIGLIVQMAYEWCQRMGDMRNLTWDCLDLDSRILTLEQADRRAKVVLPISDELMNVILQQRKDYGFQAYVAPHPKPVAGVHSPYAMERLSKTGRAVMRLAGLPERLRLLDIRRTGVVEMLDAGVSIPKLMEVTGYSYVSSLQQHINNIDTCDDSALTDKGSHVKSSTASNTLKVI